MKPHELRAIQKHPLTQLLRSTATSRRAPTRSEVIAEMEAAGLNEEQQQRAVTLCRAVFEERANGNSTWALRQAADEVSLAVLKQWSSEDSLDGSHQLYPEHYDEQVDFQAADEVAIRNVDRKHERRERIEFEDGTVRYV